MFNVPIFTVTSIDTLVVVRWMSRIFTFAQANYLTNAAALNLMTQGSGGREADYIEKLRVEAKTLN
jgi:hypothetical protein